MITRREIIDQIRAALPVNIGNHYREDGGNDLSALINTIAERELVLWNAVSEALADAEYANDQASDIRSDLTDLQEAWREVNS